MISRNPHTRKQLHRLTAPLQEPFLFTHGSNCPIPDSLLKELHRPLVGRLRYREAPAAVITAASAIRELALSLLSIPAICALPIPSGILTLLSSINQRQYSQGETMTAR